MLAKRRKGRMEFSGYCAWVQKEMSLFGGVLRWWELRWDGVGWTITHDHGTFEGDTIWRLPKNWVVFARDSGTR